MFANQLSRHVDVNVAADAFGDELLQKSQTSTGSHSPPYCLWATSYGLNFLVFFFFWSVRKRVCVLNMAVVVVAR